MRIYRFAKFSVTLGLVSVTALLMAAHGVMAQTVSQAPDDTAPVEAVVVTGSRVISDVANSPTPLTTVSTDQIEALTPSDIPDALNKLPQFQGSTGPFNKSAASSGGSLGAGNVLDLRNFGDQRTLVLLDGHRVAPTNADGSIDVDTLPSMLVSRIDIVTGGASAVYGSDAVTGVVNYILDKDFSGIKIDANSGLSNYGDAASYQLGMAAGTDLFDGKAHLEVSLRHYHSDPVDVLARPYGPEFWTQTGAGTAASPFHNTEFSVTSSRTIGGLIGCGTGCPVNGDQFVSNGVIGPFTAGASSGTAGVNSGGDGTDIEHSSVFAGLRTDDAFARFSYDIDDTTTAYINLTAAESGDSGLFADDIISPAANQPNTFFVSNPYLTPTERAQFGTASTFTLAESIESSPNLAAGVQVKGLDRNLGLTTGVEGTLMGKYDWNIFYTHAESRVAVDNIHNANNQNYYAAEDAVTNSAGQVVCNVSLTASASLYPGCVPIDPFGPGSITQSAYNYIFKTTQFVQTYVFDNGGGSISGNLFDLPAGPIKAALSAEARWVAYDVTSDALPTQLVNCTGLRICNATAPLWVLATVAPLSAKENVWEFAGEAVVPLLKDIPLVQTLDVNLAGRYTDYSTSGVAETWKIGVNWHLDDSIAFRATNSIDIRAPTLNDLYAPLSQSIVVFSDIHTNTSSSTELVTRGNPNLVPEVARTYTGGVVLTPSFIPNLTVSVDYYHIGLDNAIGSLSGNTVQVENLCQQSEGTSPYCALYVRPLPFSNTTSANYPTEVLSENLNATVALLEGWDIETDYHFNLADVWDSAPGAVSLRGLANIQPVNELLQFPGAGFTRTISPKGRVTFLAGYQLDSWEFDLQDRWLSSFNRASQPTIIYIAPQVSSFNTVDVTLNKTFNLSDGSVLQSYLSVQNVLNTQPPIDPTTGAPGEYYPVDQDESPMGRYFTVGVRAKF